MRTYICGDIGKIRIWRKEIHQKMPFKKIRRSVERYFPYKKEYVMSE